MHTHYAVIKYLNETFETVILPPFETSKMVAKREGKRKISKRTAKEMLSLGHYEFKQKCLDKLGDRVKILNEGCTSKTCTQCGSYKNIGGKEVYSCNVFSDLI